MSSGVTGAAAEEVDGLEAAAEDEAVAAGFGETGFGFGFATTDVAAALLVAPIAGFTVVALLATAEDDVAVAEEDTDCTAGRAGGGSTSLTGGARRMVWAVARNP